MQYWQALTSMAHRQWPTSTLSRKQVFFGCHSPKCPPIWMKFGAALLLGGIRLGGGGVVLTIVRLVYLDLEMDGL